jgi:sugar phosphate isomerase/epimerase
MREVVVPTYLTESDPILVTVHQYAAAGVRLIELHGDAPQTHIDLCDEAAVRVLAAAVRELPIEVRSVHCPYSQPREEAWDISQLDDRRRSAALRNHGKIIASSARLGADQVVVHPGVRHRGQGRLAHSRASLAQLAERAQNSGTRIAVENLPPGFPGSSVAEMRSMLDGVDQSTVGLCLDTGHAMLGENAPADYVRALGDRTFGIHWHTNDGSSDAHLIPDLRRRQWEEFFTALAEVGCNVPVTVEADFPPATTLDAAIRSIRAALQGSRELRFP